MKNEEWQLILSVVALVLTPFLSALVVRHQLKKTHEWWKKEQTYLDAKELKEKKYKLYEDCARFFPELRTLIIEYQVFQYSKNECEFLLQNKLFDNRFTQEFIESEFNRYKILSLEHNTLIRIQLSKTKQLFFLAKGYYSLDLIKKFEELILAFEEAKKQIISYNEMSELINKKMKDGKPIQENRDEVGKLFDLRCMSVESNLNFESILIKMFNENHEIN